MFTPPMILGCGSLLLYIVFDILGCREDEGKTNCQRLVTSD